ncbi:MAG TPA: hypothetical protein VHZ50_16315 [Puia sp.]|jgi:hypothetical protein|nr:hypothetical protein [Puia sp.]
MKFFETLDAIFVNVDEISYIGHEYENASHKYYSYIYLKNGKKLEFLDLPDLFEDNKKFDSNHLVTLHRYAVGILCSSEEYLVKYDDLMESSWELFITEFDRANIK